MAHRQELVYVDSSEILDGKLDKDRMLIHESVNFAEANEPTLLTYHIYIDESGKKMSVFQVHPDSASLERRHCLAAMWVFEGTLGALQGLARSNPVGGGGSEGIAGRPPKTRVQVASRDHLERLVSPEELMGETTDFSYPPQLCKRGASMCS